MEINRKKDGNPTGNLWNSVASQEETVGNMAETTERWYMPDKNQRSFDAQKKEADEKKGRTQLDVRKETNLETNGIQLQVKADAT